MQQLRRQSGFSLSTVIIIGVALLLAIIYGRNIISLAYHGYQAKKIMLIVADKDATEVEARKHFSEQINFEHLDEFVNLEDLAVEQTAGKLVLSMSYKECAKVSDSWEICKKQDLTTAR